MNVQLSYKPPSYWRIIFWYGGRPRQFSCRKKFRYLVVPCGGCCKGIVFQGILTPTGVLPNWQSFLRIKGSIKGASFHAPRQRNSMYVQMVRISI